MRDEPWVVVDTETNGLMSPIYTVEIAAQRMQGWARDGQPFRMLLNHDVPIDRAAEALHGYSRDFLLQNGSDPIEAHHCFRDYAGNLPLVAYNISFDWDRTLLPEYGRLGIPAAGKKGFCAMTLARRTVFGTANYKLETLKEHFRLNAERSHRGRNDVETLCGLFEQVFAPRLTKAAIVGFESIAAFSRQTPVARCLEQVTGAGEPVWHFVDDSNQSQGPLTLPQLKSFLSDQARYVWRDGMPEWTISTSLPEFTEQPKPERKKRRNDGDSTAKPAKADDKLYKLHYSRWVDEVIGLCQGILADGVVNELEVLKLQEWLTGCPCTHIYPINVIADHVERIVCDGIITPQELADLKECLDNLLPVTG
jgi:DNA polymerase III epsilon subunit-like protein